MQYNIDINCLSDKVKAEEADWQCWDPPKENCDIMIGADLTYDDELVRLLVKVILNFLTTPSSSLSHNQKKVVIISTIRRPETYNYFKQLLQENNRKTQSSPPPPLFLSYARPEKFEILTIF
mmetsp:Transcript_16684/g.25964  ORF Transcript_16684/g.25964 Transcript_16684/m.25964 type:complete len:122 (-) Transcript_16684:35-400(-)